MSHACLTCSPGPHRVVDHERGIVSLPRKFRGPPNSGNGGVAAGLFACVGDATLDDATKRLNVRLHRPIPLLADLDLQTKSDPDHPERVSVTVADDDGTVLSGWVSSISDPVMPAQTVDDLASLATLTDAQRHRFDHYQPQPTPNWEDFAGCFVCGPDAPDGLRLRPRPVTDEISWLDWRPEAHWHDGHGLGTMPAIAALDCTSAIGMHEWEFMNPGESTLLGTYDADIIARPPSPDPDGFRIITRPRDRNGRKILADIGLFSSTGEPYIMGRATWIVVSNDVAAGVE